MALLLGHPLYKDCKNIIGTIITNQGLEQHLNNLNKNLIRTAVGDKYVAQELEKQNSILGGEQSGHIIVGDYLKTGDGAFAALRALETIIHTNNWEFKTFEKFPQVLINIAVKEKKDLNQSPFLEIISEGKNQLDQGRLVVRYSGTENKLRVMVEEKELKIAESLGNQISQKLQQELS